MSYMNKDRHVDVWRKYCEAVADRIKVAKAANKAARRIVDRVTPEMCLQLAHDIENQYPMSETDSNKYWDMVMHGQAGEADQAGK